jgi:adenylate cyclase
LSNDVDVAGGDQPPASSISAPHDLAATYDAVEAVLLGDGPRYTRLEVAEKTGVPIERLAELWRALGFPGTRDDEPHFTDDDLEALRVIQTLVGSGVIPQADDIAIIRTLGRTFSRLADWEAGLSPEIATLPPAQAAEATRALIPIVQQLHDYAWRRHLARATARELLGAPVEGAELCVGFVDIVGFTSTSRKLSQAELGALIEHFEQTSSQVVTAHRGRVVKTIGDEILFIADEPDDAVAIGRELTSRHEKDPAFPQVRAGLAHGAVLARLGDVFGETVNIAARLTSLARPGTVLVNDTLHARLAEGVVVRRIPPASVRGYHHLEAWVLRD